MITRYQNIQAGDPKPGIKDIQTHLHGFEIRSEKNESIDPEEHSKNIACPGT